MYIYLKKKGNEMKELIKKEIKRIEGNIDMLVNIIVMEIDDFKAYGFQHITEDNRQFFFADNHADVLAIAHLDTVQKEASFSYDKKDGMIYSSFMDDRLGAYILLEHLQSELKYDILLTVDEERGKSTARSFNPDKKYKWMFSFDRKGTEVVMYQYETSGLVKELDKYGFITGLGSYSDICELEHLGCKGFNFGTGYQKGHFENGYAILNETAENIIKFRNFYNANAGKHFPHKATRKLNPGSATTTAVTYILTD